MSDLASVDFLEFLFAQRKRLEFGHAIQSLARLERLLLVWSHQHLQGSGLTNELSVGELSEKLNVAHLEHLQELCHATTSNCLPPSSININMPGQAPSAAVLQYLAECLRQSPTSRTCLKGVRQSLVTFPHNVQRRSIGSWTERDPARYPAQNQQRNGRPQQQSNPYQARDGRPQQLNNSYQPPRGQYPPRNNQFQQNPSRYTQNSQYAPRPGQFQQNPSHYPQNGQSSPRGNRIHVRGSQFPGSSPTEQQNVPPPVEIIEKKPVRISDPIEAEFTVNHNIPSTYVQQVVDGKLEAAQRLDELLESLDPALDVVRALQLNEDPKPSVVEVTTREALKAILKAKEARQAEVEKAKRDMKPKQIEFNWAIGNQDMNMKLNNMRKFLEKGKRVELLLANKKKSRRATPEESQNLIKEIESAIVEVDGCKELKPREGKVGAQMILIVGKK